MLSEILVFDTNKAWNGKIVICSYSITNIIAVFNLPKYNEN